MSSSHHKRALVTGANGFVGRVLCRHLTKRGWEVFGCDMEGLGGQASFKTCNVAEADQIAAVLDWSGPITHVFHLAARTFVPDSIEDPCGVVETNLQGSMRLLTSLHARGGNVRMVFIGSSEAYGSPQFLPITEDHPLCPKNPYAMTKAAADHFCAYAHQSMGMDIVRIRPFNHSGPGQTDQFVLASFARQIAEVEAGLREPVLEVGNLAARRDFSHVDDVVRAYECAAMDGAPGEAYNVCRGRSCVIQDALAMLLELSDSAIEVRVDPKRERPSDVPDVYGSYAKLAERTGWVPKIGFEKLLEELLAYWREAVRR